VESQRPEGAAVGEVVLVHGLEGSGQSSYMGRMAAAALRAGFAAHRFNMRTCGGTAQFSSTLYHGGLTSDLLAVLRQFQSEGRGPVFLVGFSLGGNLALKLAGELGEAALPLIRGVCGVSTPLDLEACALRIGQLRNRVYERRFVRLMRARLCAAGRYKEADFSGFRTLRAFDDAITGPSFGFGDATNYYRTQSSLRYLGGIRVPVLLIQAKDDTFVPFDAFQSEAVASNPWIRLIATAHGGHLGFVARGGPRFWADEAIIEWISGTKAINGSYKSSRS
jgi:predicted alpha/beta-fold hydrolase